MNHMRKLTENIETDIQGEQDGTKPVELDDKGKKKKVTDWRYRNQVWKATGKLMVYFPHNKIIVEYCPCHLSSDKYFLTALGPVI